MQLGEQRQKDELLKSQLNLLQRRRKNPKRKPQLSKAGYNIALMD
jgi:hypothetical protein|tara:strand:- start:524 stop:658 length:135 start_codon:yes stop_codon:yes gene_type:complete